MCSLTTGEKIEKYTLIVTEKPDAAQRIAFALDSRGRARKAVRNGVPYYLAERDRKLVVVPALGHLYTVAAEGYEKSHYPVFDIRWVPRYVADKKAKRTRVWIETISELAQNADAFIDACDYDIEGSLVGYSILKYACGKEAWAKRMKYSTLTKDDIEKAYLQLKPHLDFSLIEAGRTRHEVDWLYGINLSRALSHAVRKRIGRYMTISAGRVQGPTLRFLVAREVEVRCFVPIPYWTIDAEIGIDGLTFKAQYEKERIETKKNAERVVDECAGKDGRVNAVNAKEFLQPPPSPFDLGSLQSEAYRIFGYLPARTLSIAQNLYLEALISYPRTSSQKLPPSIDYRTILSNLMKIHQYSKLAAELLIRPELKPLEGTKRDPAHPAIYPTGSFPKEALEVAEKRVWDLIVRRFLAAFGEQASRQVTKVWVEISGHRFHFEGSETLVEGWLRFYKPYAKIQNVAIPPLKKGQRVKALKVVMRDSFTKPRSRYNPASLLQKMEKANIGTKTTRAGIIQTLYDRKYIRDTRMSVTDLGIGVVTILRKHCPTVLSLELTRKLEKKMNAIQLGHEKREKVLRETIEILKPAIGRLKENQELIGEQLSAAMKRISLQERLIGRCPTCKTGILLILHSGKTGKRFIGCTNYFKGFCRTSFPLPQRGTVRPSKKKCLECGWPIVQVRIRKRPWMLCVNPKCPTKERMRSVEVSRLQ